MGSGKRLKRKVIEERDAPSDGLLIKDVFTGHMSWRNAIGYISFALPLRVNTTSGFSKFLVLSSENPGNDNIVSGTERS